MIIRMFEYGFKKAKELSRYENDDETVIYIPKQLVIFIEQNRNIKDELKMKLIFPDGQEVDYRVLGMKYWEYDDKKIIEEKMYPLLPLQVFKLRYKMEGIKRKGESNKSELRETVLEAKKVAETIAREGKALYDDGEIDGEDLHRVLLAIGNLFEYLNEKYGNDKKLEEEVKAMTKTLYDPVIEERGIIKGKIKVAKKLILLGLNLEEIVEATELPREEIKKLLN